MCVLVAVDLRGVGLVTYHLLTMYNCVAIFRMFFRMTCANDVASDSPPASACVVETRFGQGSPCLGIASPSEYFLHKMVHRSMKQLSQCRYIPVGHCLRHCWCALLYVGTWNVCSLLEASGDR